MEQPRRIYFVCTLILLLCGTTLQSTSNEGSSDAIESAVLGHLVYIQEVLADPSRDSQRVKDWVNTVLNSITSDSSEVETRTKVHKLVNDINLKIDSLQRETSDYIDILPIPYFDYVGRKLVNDLKNQTVQLVGAWLKERRSIEENWLSEEADKQTGTTKNTSSESLRLLISGVEDLLKDERLDVRIIRSIIRRLVLDVINADSFFQALVKAHHYISIIDEKKEEINTDRMNYFSMVPDEHLNEHARQLLREMDTQSTSAIEVWEGGKIEIISTAENWDEKAKTPTPGRSTMHPGTTYPGPPQNTTLTFKPISDQSSIQSTPSTQETITSKVTSKVTTENQDDSFASMMIAEMENILQSESFNLSHIKQLVKWGIEDVLQAYSQSEARGWVEDIRSNFEEEIYYVNADVAQFDYMVNEEDLTERAKQLHNQLRAQAAKVNEAWRAGINEAYQAVENWGKPRTPPSQQPSVDPSSQHPSTGPSTQILSTGSANQSDSLPSTASTSQSISDHSSIQSTPSTQEITAYEVTTESIDAAFVSVMIAYMEDLMQSDSFNLSHIYKVIQSDINNLLQAPSKSQALGWAMDIRIINLERIHYVNADVAQFDYMVNEEDLTERAKQLRNQLRAQAAKVTEAWRAGINEVYQAVEDWGKTRAFSTMDPSTVHASQTTQQPSIGPSTQNPSTVHARQTTQQPSIGPSTQNPSTGSTAQYGSLPSTASSILKSSSTQNSNPSTQDTTTSEATTESMDAATTPYLEPALQTIAAMENFLKSETFNLSRIRMVTEKGVDNILQSESQAEASTKAKDIQITIRDEQLSLELSMKKYEEAFDSYGEMFTAKHEVTAKAWKVFLRLETRANIADDFWSHGRLEAHQAEANWVTHRMYSEHNSDLVSEMEDLMKSDTFNLSYIRTAIDNGIDFIVQAYSQSDARTYATNIRSNFEEEIVSLEYKMIVYEYSTLEEHLVAKTRQVRLRMLTRANIIYETWRAGIDEAEKAVDNWKYPTITTTLPHRFTQTDSSPQLNEGIFAGLPDEFPMARENLVRLAAVLTGIEDAQEKAVKKLMEIPKVNLMLENIVMGITTTAQYYRKEYGINQLATKNIRAVLMPVLIDPDESPMTESVELVGFMVPIFRTEEPPVPDTKVRTGPIGRSSIILRAINETGEREDHLGLAKKDIEDIVTSEPRSDVHAKEPCVLNEEIINKFLWEREQNGSASSVAISSSTLFVSLLLMFL